MFFVLKVGLESLNLPQFRLSFPDRATCRNFRPVFAKKGAYAFTGTRGALGAGYHAMAPPQDLGFEVGLRLMGL